jgi:hypothetical protein
MGASGIGSHMSRVHKKKCDRNVNYKCITSKINKKESKHKPLIVKPEMSYIDIPAVIRVPLTMGIPTIVQSEE